MRTPDPTPRSVIVESFAAADPLHMQDSELYVQSVVARHNHLYFEDNLCISLPIFIYMLYIYIIYIRNRGNRRSTGKREMLRCTSHASPVHTRSAKKGIYGEDRENRELRFELRRSG